MPDLSIVLVNWNTRALLRDCLASIQANSDNLVLGLIVVDNNSTDDSVATVTRDFPNVKLICNESNLGFARANNQGLRASQGRYVLFLNSDTLVPAHSLSALVDFMESHSKIGACSPRLARADGSTQPFAFGDDPTPSYLFRRGIAHLFLHRSLHNWETTEPQAIDWVSGACLLARCAALESVGGFDENFFMYFEDNDLCYRLRQAGWKIFYNPQVTITHFGGASLAQNKTRTQYYDASLRYFYRKHYSFFARVALEIMMPFYRRIS